MHISDFTDMKKFENIMANWALATGLATVAVDADGKYISDCYNFTDFCIKYTRGSEEGLRRCAKCDREGIGVYNCHAGLIDFSIDLTVKGEKVGKVIGGQVLPEQPDENKFREVAREIGVDEEKYIAALNKVNVRTREGIRASAELLGDVLNNYINAQYESRQNTGIIEKLGQTVEDVTRCVEDIRSKSDDLKKIQNKQKILALNATIEAARAGDVGRGFAVVATQVSQLSQDSMLVNGEIEKILIRMDTAIGQIDSQKN